MGKIKEWDKKLWFLTTNLVIIIGEKQTEHTGDTEWLKK